MSVEWKPVQGWPYEVSSDGRIRRSEPPTNNKVTFVGREVRQHLLGRYKAVNLSSKQRRKAVHIHSLVAAAFLGPRPEGMQVNHKDGDRTNNRVGNLEYVTPQENVAHANRIGLQVRGEQQGKAKLTDEAVREIRRTVPIAWKGRRAEVRAVRAAMAKKYGVSMTAINYVVQRKTWTHIKDEA